MIRIMIVDDEPSAGKILQVLIEKHIPGNKVITICNSAQEALDQMSSFQPTLVMLDVEMPKMNGFDFLNKTSYSDFDVIFTTAYDKYAIKAIRFSALDYLLKPIDILELQNAVNRHIVRKEFLAHHKTKVVNLIDNLKQESQLQFKLALSTAEGVFLIHPSDIIRCEGDNNYTHFYLAGQSPIIISRTLKEYEDILTEHGFIRIHKSHLINIHHVMRLDRDGILWMSDGEQVPVSRRRKEELRRLLSDSVSS